MRIFFAKSFGLVVVSAFTLLVVLVASVTYSRFSTTVRASNSGPAQPVLVELFTSEGCSSCPPADALLAQLDSEQFVPGAQAIVLSEHVSYWNDLGWRDPFSSQALTDRQNQYGNHFGNSGVYTPQAVVDGDQELVGSDRGKLIRAVQSAASRPKVSLSLMDVRWTGSAVTATVNSGEFAKASLIAALADDSDRSSVLRGENGGRNLRHVAVVRTLTEVHKGTGPLKSLPIRVPLPVGVSAQSKMRLIVFLADNHSGKVLGATMQTISQ